MTRTTTRPPRRPVARAAAERRALARRLRAACLAAGIDYDLGAGHRVPIDLMLAPTLLTKAQLGRLYRLSEAINRYMRRMPALWHAEADVRDVLPFGDGERAWVEGGFDPAAGPQTVITRNDFDMPDRHDRAVVFEANGCSIGGIHYAGASAQVVAEHVLAPRGQKARTLPGPNEIVATELAQHARALGLPARLTLGILENREWDAGITEMPSLARFLEARGVRCVIGDPRALRRRRGGFHLEGTRVDLLYRNMELTDLVELERDGHGLAPLREMFRRNLVVSGIAGDFDHKSLLELLTNKRLQRFVDPADRALLRDHLLWTRLLRETATDDPRGREVDLVPWVRANRRRLVLKPNQSCGGDGVTLGPRLDDAAWQRAVGRALKRGDWVVQAFHAGTRQTFPLRDGGTDRFFITFGVVSAPSGQGILGRACVEPVVNVSRGGGLMGVFGAP